MKILKFSANWCAPCNNMQTQIDRLKKEDKINIEIEHIDVDSSTEVAKKYGIRSIPTLIKLNGDVEISRSTGAMSDEKLMEFCNE